MFFKKKRPLGLKVFIFTALLVIKDSKYIIINNNPYNILYLSK